MRIFLSALVGLGAWIALGTILHFVFPSIPSIPGINISERAMLILCTAVSSGMAWIKLK